MKEETSIPNCQEQHKKIVILAESEKDSFLTTNLISKIVETKNSEQNQLVKNEFLLYARISFASIFFTLMAGLSFGAAALKPILFHEGVFS